MMIKDSPTKEQVEAVDTQDVVVEDTTSSDSGDSEGEETDALSYFQQLGNED